MPINKDCMSAKKFISRNILGEMDLDQCFVIVVLTLHKGLSYLDNKLFKGRTALDFP